MKGALDPGVGGQALHNFKKRTAAVHRHGQIEFLSKRQLFFKHTLLLLAIESLDIKVKPDLTDIGIIGQRVPLPMDELCRNCKACEKTCPIHAAHVEEGKFRPDTEKCNNCGRCVKACPFTAIDCIDGYKITIGGRWGKRVAQGNALHKIFTSEEEVVKTVEKAILFFRDQGIPGERFSDTIARVGFDCAEKMILSDELLERKDEILAKTL